jgi:hypothetical protein
VRPCDQDGRERAPVAAGGSAVLDAVSFAEELSKRAAADQAARKACEVLDQVLARGVREEDLRPAAGELIARVAAVDADNAAWLEVVIGQHGLAR